MFFTNERVYEHADVPFWELRFGCFVPCKNLNDDLQRHFLSKSRFSRDLRRSYLLLDLFLRLRFFTHHISIREVHNDLCWSLLHSTSSFPSTVPVKSDSTTMSPSCARTNRRTSRRTILSRTLTSVLFLAISSSQRRAPTTADALHLSRPVAVMRLADCRLGDSTRRLPFRLRAVASSLEEEFANDNSNKNNDEDVVPSAHARVRNQKKNNKNYHWNKQNFAIALPALIGMLADPLLSLMDTAYVGRVGSIELAALGACTSIFHLAFNAFRATTTATTSLVASALSSSTSSTADAQQVTSISLWCGWWMGWVVAAGLLLGGTGALRGMGVGTSSELYPAAAAYLSTRAWAAPVVLSIVVAEGAFRGHGDTVVPLMASAVAAVINLVLDPVLMFTAGWGVRGAAAATALSQVGAAVVYGVQLMRRRMLPPIRKGWGQQEEKLAEADNTTTTALVTTTPKKTPTAVILRTILGANLAMLMKQGSLLLGWAFATARATRLGTTSVAAHQVALSVWLIFALIQDGAAVSAQVLMSRAYATSDKRQVDSLIKYMLKFAVLQGIVSMLVLDGLDFVVPGLFTPDKMVQRHLHRLMSPLALQQTLVSTTLVVESLAIGANQFQILGVGSVVSTVASIYVSSQQATVQGIWAAGITTLFAVRLAAAVMALVRARLLLTNKTISTSSPESEGDTVIQLS